MDVNCMNGDGRSAYLQPVSLADQMLPFLALAELTDALALRATVPVALAKWHRRGKVSLPSSTCIRKTYLNNKKKTLKYKHFTRVCNGNCMVRRYKS